MVFFIPSVCHIHNATQLPKGTQRRIPWLEKIDKQKCVIRMNEVNCMTEVQHPGVTKFGS